MKACLFGEGRAAVEHDARTYAAGRLGARPVASAAELAEQADTVLFSLPDSHTVYAVAYGNDGLLSRIESGRVVVDLIYCDASLRAAHP